MEKVLKNPVVVVNKTGAAGAVGMSFVANSKPDGYNLLMALSSISIIPEADKLFDRKPAYTMDQLIPIALDFRRSDDLRRQRRPPMEKRERICR